MLNDRIRNAADLERALITAERKLKPYQDDVRALPEPVLSKICCVWSCSKATKVHRFFNGKYNVLDSSTVGTPSKLA